MSELEVGAMAPVEKRVAKKKAESVGGFTVLDGYFRVPTGTYKILKRNIEKSVPTLLIGATGNGKTELIAAMGADMDLPVSFFDMGTMIDPIIGLVGTHTIKIRDGQTHSSFIRSRFSRAIQNLGIVGLDEISRSGLQCNNLLFPVLDFRKELAMEYSFEDTDPIKVHPKCVFIATANMGSQYTGTHKLDRALVDRFMTIEVDPLEQQQILDIIEHHYPDVDIYKRTRIVECYISINKLYESNDTSFNMSLRHLKMIASLVQDGFTIYDSFYAICKGLGSKEGLKSIEQVLKTAASIV